MNANQSLVTPCAGADGVVVGGTDSEPESSADELAYEAPDIRIDYYRRHDGQLITWSGTFDPRPAIVQLEPAQRGSKTNIY